MTADRDGKILGARRHAADRRGGGASRCSPLPVRHGRIRHRHPGPPGQE